MNLARQRRISLKSWELRRSRAVGAGNLDLIAV